MIITGNCERSQYFNFQIILLRNENRFQATGALFLAEIIKIKNKILPHKTGLSEPNVKTYRLENTKFAYQVE